jgi:hypothetical protein
MKESLRNMGLQFIEVSKTTTVSIVLSTFDFLYKLGILVTHLSLHPSPRVSR